MFEILVYLYENYFRPNVRSNPGALKRKLSAVGFDEHEISDTINWLDVLSKTSHIDPQQEESNGFRIYAIQEMTMLGKTAIGFIYFLESAKLINSLQREIIIERALAINDFPISLDKLKIIVLMTLWGQGKDPNVLLLDELLLSDEMTSPHLLH